MARNLYILAGTLGLFALVCFLVTWTGMAHSAGDHSLWTTMGLGLLVIALLVALAGMLSRMFEQAEMRDEEMRRARRKGPGPRA